MKKIYFVANGNLNARHPEMADNAISKMLDWYQTGGKADIGF